MSDFFAAKDQYCIVGLRLVFSFQNACRTMNTTAAPIFIARGAYESWICGKKDCKHNFDFPVYRHCCVFVADFFLESFYVQICNEELNTDAYSYRICLRIAAELDRRRRSARETTICCRVHLTTRIAMSSTAAIQTHQLRQTSLSTSPAPCLDHIHAARRRPPVGRRWPRGRRQRPVWRPPRRLRRRHQRQQQRQQSHTIPINQRHPTSPTTFLPGRRRTRTMSERPDWTSWINSNWTWLWLLASPSASHCCYWR